VARLKELHTAARRGTAACQCLPPYANAAQSCAGRSQGWAPDVYGAARRHGVDGRQGFVGAIDRRRKGHVAPESASASRAGVCREWSRLDGRRRARLLGTYDLLPMPLTVRARRPRPRRGAHAVKGPRRSETPSAVPKAALSKLRGGAETSVGHGSFLRKPSAKYRPSVGR